MRWYRREKLTSHLRELAPVSVVLEAEAVPHHSLASKPVIKKEPTDVSPTLFPDI